VIEGIREFTPPLFGFSTLATDADQFFAR